MTYGLALSVAVGADWLGRFRCTPGRVLLIDNELHQETLAHRIQEVADAMGIPLRDYEDRLDIVSLRGRLLPIDQIGAIFRKNRDYSLISIDALYRMMPADAGENDNAAMAKVYNQVDRYGCLTGAATSLVHHSSKGSQADKDVTDVGAGAGSQSRAADTHIVIRPHEEDDCAVLEAAVRSFAPVEPLAIRWTFPIWTPADDVDPSRLRRQPSPRQQKQFADDAEGTAKIHAALAGRKRLTARELRGKTGISRDRMNRLLDQMESQERVIRSTVTKRGNECSEYRLAPPKEDVGGF